MTPLAGSAARRRRLDALLDEYRNRARNAQRRHCLYRHYDAEGVLLYVGITFDPSGRGVAHAKNLWAQFATRFDGVWHEDLDAARRAETATIHSEAPIFNVVGAGGLPAMRERAARYIATRDPSLLPLLGDPSEAVPTAAKQAVEHAPVQRAMPVVGQVTGYYREAIRTGALAVGDVLPANRPLAELWSISTATALRVVQVLAAEGLIATRSGRPPVVLDYADAPHDSYR